MTHFLDRKDPWGHGMGLWVLVAFVALLPPAIWSLRGTHLNNDIKNWVPADDPNVKTLDWYHSHFSASESVVVTWQGSSLNDPRVKWLVDRLEGVPDVDGIKHGGLLQVERVITPQELLRKIEGENISSDEALARLQGILVGTGSLKLTLTEQGQAAEAQTLKLLQERLKADLKLDIRIFGPFTDWQPNEDLSEYKLAQRIIEAPNAEPFAPLPLHHAQVEWPGMMPRAEQTQRVIEIAQSLKSASGTPLIEKAFFASGSPIGVAVVLSKRGMADLTETLQAIRSVTADVGIAPETLHLAGRPVANSELNQAVKRAAWNKSYPIWWLPGRSLIAFSGLVGAVLALLMLKSKRLTAIVLFGAYYTVLVTVALVPAMGGSMNMVLVVMPTLLLVTTMEAGVHVVSYWRYAAKKNPETAVTEAIKMATMPCFLASITGAFGLASLMSSSLTPVYDFGKYSALGSLIGYGVTLYGLPPLLAYLPKKIALGGDDEKSSRTWERIASKLVMRHGLVSFACVLVAACCSAGLMWFKTETKAIRYFPESSQVVKDYRFVEEQIGGIVPVDIVIRFPEKMRSPSEDGLIFSERQEVVRRIQNKLIDQHRDISGCISLATFRPTMSEEALLARKTSNVQRRLENAAEKKLQDPESTARSFLVFANQDVVLEKTNRTLCKKGDELWRITAQVNIMTDADYSVLTKEIASIIAAEAAAHPGIDSVVTGMIPLFLETQQAVLTSMIQSFWWAFLSIWLTLAIVLRSPLGGFIAMIPNALPVSVVFGLVSWLGVAIDVGTMITASVALGISVDATLHMLTWFRDGLAKGRTRRLAVAEALGHCGPALCQTGVVVGIGLLVLWPAELTLISRFGWLMAAMVAMALLGTLIWLPALLGGWFGTVIINQERKRQAKLECDAAVEAAAKAAEAVAALVAMDTSPIEEGDVTRKPVPEPHFHKHAQSTHETTDGHHPER